MIQLTEQQERRLWNCRCEAEERAMETIKELALKPELYDEITREQIEKYLEVGEGYLINIDEDIKLIDTERTWGRCHRVSEVWTFAFPYIHQIQINVRLIEENVEEEYLINTLVHEIFHSVADNLMEASQGHKGMWKILAATYNELYPETLPITRCKGVPNVRKSEAKYIIECPKCHTQWKYQREVKAVKHPELYRCNKCHSQLERVL